MYILLCILRLEYLHICVYFYKVRDTTPWPFRKCLEGSALILRYHLSIVLLPAFSDETMKFSYNLMTVNVRAGFNVWYDFIGGFSSF